MSILSYLKSILFFSTVSAITFEATELSGNVTIKVSINAAKKARTENIICFLFIINSLLMVIFLLFQ